MARSMLLTVVAISFALALVDALKSDTLPPESEYSIKESKPDHVVSLSKASTDEKPLSNCAAKISLDCASQILSETFFQPEDERKCCKQLKKMGKKCNDVLVTDILAEGAPVFHERTEHFWNQCLNVLAKN